MMPERKRTQIGQLIGAALFALATAPNVYFFGECLVLRSQISSIEARHAAQRVRIDRLQVAVWYLEYDLQRKERVTMKRFFAW